MLFGNSISPSHAAVVADGANVVVNGNEDYPNGEILEGEYGVRAQNSGSALLTTDTVKIQATQAAVRAESGGSATVGNTDSFVELTASAQAARPTAIYANTNSSVLVLGESVQATGASGASNDYARALYAWQNSTVTVDADRIILKGVHSRTGTVTKAYVVQSANSVVNIGTSDSAYVELRATATTEANSGANNDRTSRIIFARGGEVNVNGQEIVLAVSGYEAIGAAADRGASITVGNKNSSLDIDVMGTTMAIGLRAEGSSEYGAASIALTGSLVDINAESGNGTGIGLMALNATESATRPEETTTIAIESGSTRITADGVGISAYSNSEVHLNTALDLSAPTAIEVRGNSLVNINSDDQNRPVQIDGDISFATASEGSGLKLNADVQIHLRGEESYWNGNVKTEFPNDLSEDNQKVTEGVSLALADGAAWNATIIEGTTGESNTSKALALNNLTLENGVINATEVNQTVTVKNLTVTKKGGTFNAVTTQGQDGTFTSSKLSAQTVDSADNAVLTVNYSGINADQITAENTSSLSAVEVEGLSTTEVVDEGNIKGAWTRTTTADGETTESYGENTKLSSYSSINAMSLVQWRNEINHLTKRLGDIRASESTIGAWARVYGGSSEWGSNPEIEMDHTTIQVGGDYRVSPNWIVGGAFSYTDSDAESSNGFADGKSYSLAAYATYLADNGSFLDMIARYGYLKNDITAGNMALETKNNAFSLSVEGGHQFRFIEDRAYIEPQIELTYGFVSGDDADASNSVRIEQDDYQNLITRVGVRTGFDFPEKAGTIYATLSYSYDFLGDADGTASGQTEAGYESVALTEDLGGGWVTYGIGAQFRLGDNAFAYGELERTSGGDIDNPYLFNVGFRYNF